MANDRTVVIERIPAPGAPPAHLAQEEHPGFRIAALVARVVLGVVMLIAGAEKLGALEAFGANIYNYQILPVELVNIAALLFVWAEITVGVLLVVGAGVRGSAMLSGLMLALFIVAIGSAMARGLKIDCGCFVGKDAAHSATVGSAGVPPTTATTATTPTTPTTTPSTTTPATPAATDADAATAKKEPQQVGWPKIFEDLGLLALAVFLVYYPRSPLSVDAMLRREDTTTPVVAQIL
jgi:uncharacterized membrane protein YphA (DoxX/SURF4 family)